MATRESFVCRGCTTVLQGESNKFLLGLKNSGGLHANVINRGYHGCDVQ